MNIRTALLQSNIQQTYLAHHELERPLILIIITTIIIYIILFFIIIIIFVIISIINNQQPTCFSNVALSMAEGPDDGVDHQLKLVWRHGEEGAKTVVGYGSQQAIEM